MRMWIPGLAVAGVDRLGEGRLEAAERVGEGGLLLPPRQSLAAGAGAQGDELLDGGEGGAAVVTAVHELRRDAIELSGEPPGARERLVEADEGELVVGRGGLLGEAHERGGQVRKRAAGRRERPEGADLTDDVAHERGREPEGQQDHHRRVEVAEVAGHGPQRQRRRPRQRDPQGEHGEALGADRRRHQRPARWARDGAGQGGGDGLPWRLLHKLREVLEETARLCPAGVHEDGDAIHQFPPPHWVVEQAAVVG